MISERQSAEAQVSNFKYNFREEDPDHRFRVQAIIQKTQEEAQAKINKKMFAKHLENSKLDQKNIVDSKKARADNNKAVRADFYKKRDAQILKEEKFDIAEERHYQAKQHYRFESNQSKQEVTFFIIAFYS